MRKPSKKKILKDIKEYLQPVCCDLCVRDILNKVRIHNNKWEAFLKERLERHKYKVKKELCVTCYFDLRHKNVEELKDKLQHRDKKIIKLKKEIERLEQKIYERCVDG